MCSFAAVVRMLFLQYLHCWISGGSSSGRPVAKVSRDASSRGFTTGPGDGAAALLLALAAFLDFFSMAAMGAPSFQFPGLLYFGTGFFSFIIPDAFFPPFPAAWFFEEATLMVVSSSVDGNSHG
ncbi:hypothetical protein VTK73DRAFT_1774 [Phialemonium thermophilum]|uniref:Secreted protein n=1 Tax=Phialemonium thermophilum TaxID=223376 RepID=A0ABR3VT23_9PEZI